MAAAASGLPEAITIRTGATTKSGSSCSTRLPGRPKLKCRPMEFRAISQPKIWRRIWMRKGRGNAKGNSKTQAPRFKETEKQTNLRLRTSCERISDLDHQRPMKQLLLPIEKRCGSIGHSFLREGLPRGLALFFALFTFANLVGTLRLRSFDANLWWIDLRWLPPWAANSFLTLASIVFISFAFVNASCPLRRALTLFFSGSVGIVCLGNAANFLVLLGQGK